MTVQSNFSSFRGVEFCNLVLAPENVRKAPSEAGIPDLAHSIRHRGVLQNLTGYELEQEADVSSAPRIAVVAGGRRWRALQLLLEEGTIGQDYIVPLCVTSKEAAIAISLAENSDREALHPADEFEAARALVDAGRSIEDIAAQLHLDPLTVRRRLKLASVAPEFIQLYRQGKLNLEHMMAFAVTDDADKQRSAWKTLPEYARTPGELRQALTATEVSSSDPVVRFLGLKAYEKAGGTTRGDLFSDDSGVFLQDVTLVERLAREKLEKHGRKLARQGWAWIEVRTHIDYADRASYSLVKLTRRDPTAEEAEKIESLSQELEQVRSAHSCGDSDDGNIEDSSAKESELEKALDAAREELLVPDPEQRARAGALVTIDYHGKLRVETGLLKPEDARLFAADDRRRAGRPTQREHSAALLKRFTALRTQALMAEFAQNPEVALTTVVHRLLINAFPERAGASSALRIVTNATPLHQFNDQVETTHAHEWLTAQRDHLLSMLPTEPEALFGWLLEQSHEEKLALLAFCAARTLDAVQTDEAITHADEIARALHMDLRHWWQPTAEGYLTCIPKAAVLRAVAEAVSPQQAARIEKFKKGPLAVEAEKLLAGRGWLPPFVRENWTVAAPLFEQGAAT